MYHLTSAGREHWGGNLGFILAATGSAIGLGNIWKFPYITGENGGGAFVLVYLICIAVIGLPIMICEIALGRYAQKDPMGAFLKVAPNPTTTTRSAAVLFLLLAAGLLCFGKFGLAIVFVLIAAATIRYGWGVIGILCVVTPFLVLSYYGTVGGWTIAYFFKGIFQGLNFTTPEAAKETFVAFSMNPYWSVFYQLLFISMCGLVVWFGIRNGIELASKCLLPLLFFLLVILLMRSLTLPGASAGVRFLLSPDFSKLSAEGVLCALGHAFFSLSLGMGAMLTYGSYLDQNKNIFANSLTIVSLDTFFALMAGLAIFPAVFAVGLDPQAGPGLVFQIMPMTFNSIGDHFGWVWCSLFFLLLFIAALTSGISIMEVCVSCLIDQFGWKRRQAAFWTTAAIAFVGVLCTLSVSDWERLRPIQSAMVWLFGSANNSMFDLTDNVSSNYLLPLGGVGISLFVGWVWGTRYAVAEIRRGASQYADVNFFALLAGLKDDPVGGDRTHTFTLAMIWGIFIRFLSPAGIAVAFLHSIGWVKLGF